MPEYVVGLFSCICKKPNVKSRFLVLSRFSKSTGLMTYSPEFGMLSCTRKIIVAIRVKRHADITVCKLTDRYNVDVHEFGCDRHFSVTIKRYLYLRVIIRREILLFPCDLYPFGPSLTHRPVLKPNALGSCGRSL